MKKKHLSQKNQHLNLVIVLLQALLSVLLMWQLVALKILPNIVILAIFFIVVLLFLVVLAAFLRKPKKKKTLLRVFSILLSILFAIGSFYLYRTSSALNKILGIDYQTHSVQVYVMDKSAYQSIQDLKDQRFGVNLITDQENIEKTIETIKTALDQEIQLTVYDSFQDMTDALYAGEIEAMIMNEAYEAITTEYIETFQTDTRVVYLHQIEEALTPVKQTLDVTKDTFTVYISGIDTYGPVSTVSRSDVNILMTINPQNKQILLTNIPRDYYVTLHTYQALDKLTHAGIYGISESRMTLEDLLDIEIDFDVRVNFTSLVDIVDALGGITVENPTAFLQFPAGTIYLNDEEALTFARERYSFSSGDRERGRNQQRVIIGIIQKLLSPAIISNYTQLLDAVSDSIQTSISSSDVAKLVKMQLADMSGWNIQTYSLDGTGASEVTYSYGSQPLYVMVPDQTTVNQAKAYIAAMENGQVISVE